MKKFGVIISFLLLAWALPQAGQLRLDADFLLEMSLDIEEQRTENKSESETSLLTFESFFGEALLQRTSHQHFLVSLYKAPSGYLDDIPPEGRLS